ncbi:MAG: translocation/assembly module TamB domain-containing protein, partial [Spirochaetales bacterium]|nr:translocation/assembly module TamB domain-containing protein [Spirochaetales bacterium]
LGLRYEGAKEYPELRAEGYRYGKGELEVDRLWVNGAGYGLKGDLRGSLGKTIPLGSHLPDIKLSGRFSGLENPGESYVIEALYSKESIDAQIDFTGFSLAKFIPEDVSGELKGSLKAKGVLDISAIDGTTVIWNRLPALELVAELENGSLKNQPLNLVMKSELIEGRLNVEMPSIEYAGHRIEKIDAQVSLEEGKAQFVGDYKNSLGGQSLEAIIVSDAEFRFGDRSAEQNDGGFSAEFTGTLANIKFHETLVRSWTFSGSYGKGGFQLEGGGGDLEASLAPDGSFELVLADDFPLLASARGRMSGNQLSATVEDIRVDLARFGSLFPVENLQILDGDLSGSLNISGPMVDPEINGTLAVENGIIESTALLKDRIGPFNSYVNFSGRNVELVPTVVPLSTGAVELSASGLLDNWTLSDLGFNVVTRNDSVVILSTKIAGITLIDARAQLDIALSLEAGTLVATGAVYLDRGQALIDPQGFGPEAQQPIDPGAPAFRIDATINFGKQLEVYLPDSNLPIIRGFTLPGSLLYLKFDSGSGEFTLDGAIDLRSGYVFYYLRNFFIRSATIDFAENSAKFNPLVTVNAELRESGRDGVVRISLSTEKAPLSNLNPRLSSIPFYSETELIAIMSGGVLAADTTESLTIREAAIASSEFIPQLNIFKSFEQRVQKALGMDIVFIRSSFMQRWLLDLTKPASEPNPEDPLARYLDQSELYMGRYLTDSAFFHASLRFREDPLVSSSRLRLDSEFGIEFDSPFGQISWSITPFIGEGSLVSGQELSLSWRFVY